MRTSLIPGLLKSVRENRSHPLPIKIFEASDVVFKDVTLERQAKNVRHAAAVWCNKTAGFEVIHGLLDRLMAMIEVPKISSTDTKAPHGYYLKEKIGTLLYLHFPLPFVTFFLSLFEIVRFRPHILPRSSSNHLLSRGTGDFYGRGKVHVGEGGWRHQVYLRWRSRLRSRRQGNWRTRHLASNCSREV